MPGIPPKTPRHGKTVLQAGGVGDERGFANPFVLSKLGGYAGGQIFLARRRLVRQNEGLEELSNARRRPPAAFWRMRLRVSASPSHPGALS